MHDDLVKANAPPVPGRPLWEGTAHDVVLVRLELVLAATGLSSQTVWCEQTWEQTQWEQFVLAATGLSSQRVRCERRRRWEQTQWEQFVLAATGLSSQRVRCERRRRWEQTRCEQFVLAAGVCCHGCRVRILRVEDARRRKIKMKRIRFRSSQ